MDKDDAKHMQKTSKKMKTDAEKAAKQKEKRDILIEEEAKMEEFIKKKKGH